MDNVDITKSIFAAFDRGDKESIIDAMAPDVNGIISELSCFAEVVSGRESPDTLQRKLAWNHPN